MPADPRFDAPRSLARSLAEMARRSSPERAQEAELRAILPAALGPWLHARLHDVRLQERACVLVMADAASAREVEALAAEVHREVARRLGWAPPRVSAETARTRARPRAPTPPAQALESLAERPQTAEALLGVSDPALRKRLARWAGVELPK